jgi:hypothetical protein
MSPPHEFVAGYSAIRSVLPVSGKKPIVHEVEIDHVVRIAVIIGPDVSLPETNLVNVFLVALEAVGQRLGIAPGAVSLRDEAFLAADVNGRAEMADRIILSHKDDVALAIAFD